MRISVVFLVVSILAGMNSPLSAQSVVFSNSATPLPALATARYRLDSSNWDMAFYNEQSSPSATDYVTLDLGNQADLSGETFTFTLANRTGEGLVWTLSDNLNPGGPAGGRVGWGAFVPALTAPTGGGLNVAADLDGEAPGFFFNAINFELRAFAADSSFALADVAFSGASVAGAFNDVTAVFNNTGASYVGNLISDTDLSSFDWTLTGLVTGVKVGGGQEQVAFNLQMAVIPEPSLFAALLATGGLLATAAVRRRTSTRS